MLRFNKINVPCTVSFFALFFSWIGIVLLLNDQFYYSFAIILIAFILDALDGFIARKLKQESEFGRQLDSYVDIFIYLLYPALAYYLFFELRDIFSVGMLYLFLSCGIFRLSRFNVSGLIDSSKKDFKAYGGLPTYFNHLPLISILFLKVVGVKFFSQISCMIILLNSILMVLKFPSTKPKNIWPFVILLLLISLVMIYVGINESY